MRHELYADSLDVVKWTAILRAAHESGCRRVLHVAMLRPDAGGSEGLKEFEPADADPRVETFFREERHRRASGDVLRLHDIRRLGSRLNPQLDIDIVDSNFSHVDRHAYFAEVQGALQPRERPPTIVFVDPDTGISQRGGDAHVSAVEVLELRRVLSARDVLIVYSHRSPYETKDACRARVERVLAYPHMRPILRHHYANDGLLTSIGVKPVSSIGPVIRRRR